MKIDFVSDVACPWCYIGLRHLETALDSIGLPAESRDTLQAALIATGHLGLMPAPRILITGSLYLAGEVLAMNGTPPE